MTMCTRHPICGPATTEAERIENMKALLQALQEFKDGKTDGEFTKTDLIESYSLIPDMLGKISHAKAGSEVAKVAIDLIKAIFETTAKTQYWSISLPLRQLSNEELKSALSGTAKPVVKELALSLVNDAAKSCPESFRHEIEWIIHSVVLLMNDVNKNVRAIARECLQSIIYSCGNADLLNTTEADKRQGSNNFVETIVKAIEHLKQVDAAVEKLAGCIFVQQVEAPHLAVMTPIFWRGLKSSSEATQRRCCVIIENMCNVIEDPREGRPLFGETMNLVSQKSESISDPDAREMAQKTLRMLQKLQQNPPREEIDIREIIKQATDGSTNTGIDGSTSTTTPEVTTTFADNSVELKYLQRMTNILARGNVQYEQAWREVMSPFISNEIAVKCMLSVLEAGQIKEVEFVDDDTKSPDLYKGSFSLAFGTIGLLREAKLHLKRGKFYAILGPNNCGKSTLMKSIANEKLEDFPKRDELITIYVSHDVEVRELEPPSTAWPEGKTNLDLNGIEYCVDTVNVVYNKTPQITIEEAEAALGAVGFKNMNPSKGGNPVNPDSPADMLRPITDYSGGWKMKMQLACAKLIDADILTLDEPTGQLDTTNIQWMKDWLKSFLAKGGSIMAASTNAVFLNEMCTHIICFESRKLKQFKSTPGSVLSDYVALHPEKEAYFKLTDRFQSFVFPKPGILEGVKSRGRAVLKMNNVDFKYPVPEKPIETVKNTVSNITLSVCMASRISVVGRNGAGKSTAIKLLIGELKPDSGTIFRHAGMRLAYVAQHSLKHLKAHLNKTPVEYIVWRFQGNDDRESVENRSKELNVDEEKLRSVEWCIDPKSGSVRKLDVGEGNGKIKTVKPECVMGRRKNKQRKYEYDTKWQYQPVENSVWVERDTLVAMGYEKLASAEDEKQALAAGLLQRPLIAAEVERALRDFGIDSESASHNPIHSLSDGQMFRVVLTAAMWLCPHILILDEPTNYLDRDGIGALVSGLESFEGGVVVISHDAEFASTVCPDQKWVMQQGNLREEGCDIEAQVKEQEKTRAMEGEGGTDDVMGKMPDEITTANGETIKIVKQLTEKERKKAIKDITKRLKEDKKKKVLTDGERWDLEDQLAEHETQLCP